MCRRNRSRHCFVSRTPSFVAKQRRDRCSQTDCSCTCPVAPQRRRANSRRCSCTDIRQRCPSLESSSYQTSVDCCCPPPTPPLPSQRSRRGNCLLGRRKPKRPICPAAPPKCCTVKKPNCYPAPQLSCHPAPQLICHPVAPPSPPLTRNDCMEEPSDSYYSYNPNQQNHASPMPNFDLNRFNRDATANAPDGYGRRRNVSIRTCLDYDYDPGTQTPMPSAQYGQRGYAAPRPNFRQPPPPSYTEYIAVPQDSFTTNGTEDDEASAFVPCRRRRNY